MSTDAIENPVYRGVIPYVEARMRPRLCISAPAGQGVGGDAGRGR
jgi:hypothetical protein